jgi:hypothetical protein
VVSYINDNREVVLEQTAMEIAAATQTSDATVAPPLLFFYRAFHLASAGSGLPAICDCTWATIRESAA